MIIKNMASITYHEIGFIAARLQKELVEVRRNLHQNPELSWNEHQTSATIRQILEAHGIPVSPTLAGTGFYCDIAGRGPGKTVAYRADIDALPIQDMKQVAYASGRPVIGHMCGHDYHTSVALGVALTLHDLRNEFNGVVRVFWQPAEESTPSGAPSMIEDGVLQGVDAVFGIHCDPHLDSGKVGIRKGALTGSFDAFEIEIKVKQSLHSARPHLGTDAMWLAHQLVQQMYLLPTRITDARLPAVISVCTFNGGSAVNVIPDAVRFSGTIRTSDPVSRKTLCDRVRALCSGMAEIHTADVTCTILGGAPPVINDDSLYEYAEATLHEILDETEVTYPEQSMGAEDFAYYGEHVPTHFMRIGTCGGPSTSHALHTSLFDVDESTIKLAVSTQSWLLLNYLNKF